MYHSPPETLLMDLDDLQQQIQEEIFQLDKMKKNDRQLIPSLLLQHHHDQEGQDEELEQDDQEEQQRESYFQNGVANQQITLTKNDFSTYQASTQDCSTNKYSTSNTYKSLNSYQSNHTGEDWYATETEFEQFPPNLGPPKQYVSYIKKASKSPNKSDFSHIACQRYKQPEEKNWKMITSQQTQGPAEKNYSSSGLSLSPFRDTTKSPKQEISIQAGFRVNQRLPLANYNTNSNSNFNFNSTANSTQNESFGQANKDSAVSKSYNNNIINKYLKGIQDTSSWKKNKENFTSIRKNESLKTDSKKNQTLVEVKTVKDRISQRDNNAIEINTIRSDAANKKLKQNPLDASLRVSTEEIYDILIKNNNNTQNSSNQQNLEDDQNIQMRASLEQRDEASHSRSISRSPVKKSSNQTQEMENSPTFVPMLSKKSLLIAEHLQNPMERLINSKKVTQLQIQQLKEEESNQFSFQPQTNNFQTRNQIEKSNVDSSRFRDSFQDSLDDRRANDSSNNDQSEKFSKGRQEKVPRWEQLYEMNQIRDLNIRMKIMEKVEKEDNDPDLTFKPKLIQSKSQLYFGDSDIGVAERNAFWHKKQEDKLKEMRKNNEGKGVQECTFKPQIIDQNEIDMSDFKVTEFNQKGIIDYFDRIELANQKKKEKEIIFEKKSQTNTWKNQVTVPQEFQFMTQNQKDKFLSNNNNNNPSFGFENYNSQLQGEFKDKRSLSSNNLFFSVASPPELNYNGKENQGNQLTDVVSKLHQRLLQINL